MLRKCLSISVHRDDPNALHATKLPLSTWLRGLWLILQSDKGISSPRLAEALGLSRYVGRGVLG